ncbi:hypothetical protein HanOQP8_Chr14g0510341 [Helianthus annuus]|nr:hypothetical protein HanOQP8_Chr14g0510341 [Helianthus annuus]
MCEWLRWHGPHHTHPSLSFPPFTTSASLHRFGKLLSGNSLYDSASGDVWVNKHRFKIIRQLCEGGFPYVFLVKEVINDTSEGEVSDKIKDPSHISDDETYAMKEVLIQNNEQFVCQEELKKKKVGVGVRRWGVGEG